MVDTPCIDICKIDSANGLCIGCWRNIDEITRWPDMTGKERMAVMNELLARRSGATEEK